MAIYAIGDLQGCLDPLQRLLERVRFDPSRDQLWFCGDLINRGPQSLETLRFVRDLGERAITVLGNHDLNLLAVAHAVRPLKRSDTLAPILEAPDRAELLDWLRWRPLLHHDPKLRFTLVHAGIPPDWDLAEALALAAECEAQLRGERWIELLGEMYGNQPDRWNPALQGWDRYRYILNGFTRMRYCDPSGRLDFRDNGPLGTQQPGYLPWFKLPQRRSRRLRILFGHWAALGHFRGSGLFALDSGCVWGQRLTALRLDHPFNPAFSVSCGR